MTLPVRLRPWWPLLKRGHRVLTLACGILFRALAPVLGGRGVPRSATSTSADAASAEPGSVVVHPGGPAEVIDRGAAAGDPAGHWMFETARHAEIDPRYTLEICGGRVTGDFGAVITPEHRLDLQTSPYFGIDDWREHPVFLRPTLGEVERVRGTVLSLTARGTAANYYHFLYDAIARYGIVQECLPGERFDAVVVPHRSGYQRQLLELAGITAPLIQPRRGHTVEADRLLVPSLPNWALDAPPSAVAWLRERLPSTGRTDTPRRLYLTRGTAPNTRRYVQEPELLPLLERRGFVSLDPGTLSVQEQIDVFCSAEVIVAPHGAALTNVTFSRPGVKVLEMFAGSYVHLGLWAICAALDGIDYRYVVGEGPHRPGRPLLGVLDDVSIPVPRVLAALDALLSG